ncbi:NADH-quinone reductase [Arsenicitalea aurantiaca]|uniref:NADH-quinone reductase n=1 Tax=Arsenicitalea aurantiaca TaxID=1783274 RepID=A0A433XE79_9HYPH|nr:RnfABCDGE type electron transport complex subunit D [Arsenicitalea aurantiaca]RUT32419.1 NADH-quinone reductase [Arsenicitalea aurantiaca]
MMPSRLTPLATHPLLRGQLPVLAGLALPLLWSVWGDGPAVLGRVALVGAIVLAWQVVFTRIRRQGFGLEGISAAIIIALLVPATAPVWQLVLGTTFGVVIGLLVFGGYGRNILHPAVVTLAFLMFSFAGEGYREASALPIWTLVPALLLLTVSGQANWRVLAGALLGLLGLGWLQAVPEATDLAQTGLFWLVLLFLVADPVASAATDWSRPFHGLLFGVLATLFLQTGTAISTLVFAALMAAIFAPLLDAMAIAVNARIRERRHG